MPITANANPELLFWLSSFKYSLLQLDKVTEVSTASFI